MRQTQAPNLKHPQNKIILKFNDENSKLQSTASAKKICSIPTFKSWLSLMHIKPPHQKMKCENSIRVARWFTSDEWKKGRWKTHKKHLKHKFNKRKPVLGFQLFFSSCFCSYSDSVVWKGDFLFGVCRSSGFDCRRASRLKKSYSQIRYKLNSIHFSLKLRTRRAEDAFVTLRR